VLQNYIGPLEVGKDLMSFEISETVTMNVHGCSGLAFDHLRRGLNSVLALSNFAGELQPLLRVTRIEPRLGRRRCLLGEPAAAGDLSLRKVLALYVSCDPSQTRHHHKQIKIQCRERRATKPATPTGFFSSTILRSADSATVFAGKPRSLLIAFGRGSDLCFLQYAATFAEFLCMRS
jgi:hypothetical protein